MELTLQSFCLFELTSTSQHPSPTQLFEANHLPLLILLPIELNQRSSVYATLPASPKRLLLRHLVRPSFDLAISHDYRRLFNNRLALPISIRR